MERSGPGSNGDRSASPRSDSAVFPFDLVIDPMRHLAIVPIDDDPVYESLEVQRFDDHIHGRGLVVLGYRHDRLVDVSHDPALRLDRDQFAVGKGIGSWVETTFEASVLEVGEAGLRCDVVYDDPGGRPVRIAISERSRGRRPFGLLAPLGHGVAHPTSLPVFYMEDFDLARCHASRVRIEIGGRRLCTRRLPIPVAGRRRWFIRYAGRPIIGVFSRRHHGVLEPISFPDGATVVTTDVGTFHSIRFGDHIALERMSAGAGGHELWVSFRPAFPDLRHVLDGTRQTGRFTVGLDGMTLTGGKWSLERTSLKMAIDLDVDRRWKPRHQPVALRVMFAVLRFFTSWPLSYRWGATVDIRPEGLTMDSGWLHARR